MQLKIVEAALKLVSEADLKRTVKKKRKSNYVDALGQLEQIEKEINEYRKSKGRKPSQRASLIFTGRTSTVNSAATSQLVDSVRRFYVSILRKYVFSMSRRCPHLRPQLSL